MRMSGSTWHVSLYMYPSMPRRRSLCLLALCLARLARLSLRSCLLDSLLSWPLDSCSSTGGELDSCVILTVTECHCSCSVSGVDWASVCTLLTPVPAVLATPHRPGRPGVLADINRLPLTSHSLHGPGFPSLIRGPHWSLETNTGCDWFRGQLPPDQLTGGE